MDLYEIKFCDLCPTAKTNFSLRCLGMVLGAKCAPSLVFLYDLSGLEKAGGLAKEKSQFISQFTNGVLGT